MDQLFTLRKILEKKHQYHIYTHNLFIDFKQTYDSVKRDDLFFAIPTELITLCRMTLTEIRSAVRVFLLCEKGF